MSDEIHSGNLRDATLIVTKALPDCSAGAATTETDSIDLNAVNAFDPKNAEVKIQAPALATAELPDTGTMTYSVEHSSDDFVADTTILADKVIVQTGAAGAGADAADQRVKLPTSVKRYVRVKASGDATADDCTAKSVTVDILT